MNAAQLRLPYVFAFHPQVTFVSSRLRSRRRAANSAIAAQPQGTKVALKSAEEKVRADAIAFIEARHSKAPASPADLLNELAGLLTGVTPDTMQTPVQLAASLLVSVQRLAS